MQDILTHDFLLFFFFSSKVSPKILTFELFTDWHMQMEDKLTRHDEVYFHASLMRLMHMSLLLLIDKGSEERILFACNQNKNANIYI